jgi:hypothetical protein
MEKKKNMIVIVILILLFAAAAGGFGWWWFVLRAQSVPVPDNQSTRLVGKLYGNSNLTSLYEFVDSSSVRVLSDNGCVYKRWNMTTPELIEIIDVASFRIPSDDSKLTRTVDGEVFVRLVGSVSSYCDLLGKNITV